MKEKIGIVCVATRRLSLMFTHAAQLAKCKYRDFHFYLLADSIPQEILSWVTSQLPKNSTIVFGIFPNTDDNYMSKIRYGLSQGHEYCVKMDEDAILTADGWDKFFNLIESMGDDDLFCTGAISNGIPTCDLYINNYLLKYKPIIDNMFSLTRFGNPLYHQLNSQNVEPWNTEEFYKKVWGLNTHFKGIHPVRVNFLANKFMNDKIMENFPSTMKPIDSEVIRDNSKYPYFCNNIFGIRTKEWQDLLSRKDLFVDAFDEVVLSRYRNEKKKNMVIDTGIPILHTMYNWAMEWDYENKLIDQINKTFNKEFAYA